MKELFNTLSNISQFFTETRFIYDEKMSGKKEVISNKKDKEEKQNEESQRDKGEKLFNTVNKTFFGRVEDDAMDRTMDSIKERAKEIKGQEMSLEDFNKLLAENKGKFNNSFRTKRFLLGMVLKYSKDSAIVKKLGLKPNVKLTDSQAEALFNDSKIGKSVRQYINAYNELVLKDIKRPSLKDKMKRIKERAKEIKGQEMSLEDFNKLLAENKGKFNNSFRTKRFLLGMVLKYSKDSAIVKKLGIKSKSTPLTDDQAKALFNDPKIGKSVRQYINAYNELVLK